MRPEIEEFYEKNRTPVHKVISVGVTRRGIPRENIESCLVSVYKDVHNGLDIRPIRLIHEVFDRADAMPRSAPRDQLSSVIQRLEGVEKRTRTVRQRLSDWQHGRR